MSFRYTLLGCALAAATVACGQPGSPPTPTPDLQATIDAGIAIALAATPSPTAKPTATPTPRPRPFVGATRPHCQEPGTYQDIVANQTEYYRAIYERETGIGTGALSPFQEYLDRQWQRVVTAYEIDQALNRLSGADLLPFPEYLQERAGTPVASFGAGQFDALLALSLTEQRAVFERAPDYAFCNVLLSGWGLPAALARNILQRLAGPAARRAYDLTPRALAGDDTFLNYLARNNGL